jgi:hypothetical protein
MAIIDVNYDKKMLRLWGLISDVSEQLNQRQATASASRNQVGAYGAKGSSPILNVPIIPGRPYLMTGDQLSMQRVWLWESLGLE